VQRPEDEPGPDRTRFQLGAIEHIGPEAGHLRSVFLDVPHYQEKPGFTQRWPLRGRSFITKGVGDAQDPFSHFGVHALVPVEDPRHGPARDSGLASDVAHAYWHAPPPCTSDVHDQSMNSSWIIAPLGLLVKQGLAQEPHEKLLSFCPE
jgi:hypothetical protein